MKWSDAEKRKWHRWFAWYPIRLDAPDGSETVVIWFEFVWRMRIEGNFFPYWVYYPYKELPEELL